jgi:hypothetical protein
MQDMKSLGEYINKEAGRLLELALGILPSSSADTYLAVEQFELYTLTCSIIRTILTSCVGADAMCSKSCRSVRHALEKLVSTLFMVISTYLL